MRIVVFTSAVMFLVPGISLARSASAADSVQFLCNELLGRPTNSSVTIHACANKALDVYYEYGIDSLNYRMQTSVQSCVDSIPFVFVIDNLDADTKYFYRMRYRESGTTGYNARSSHNFHTQRAAGSTFTFAIEADPHLDANSNPSVYAQTLHNILLENPDFLVDLGDTFMSEKLLNQTQDSITIRHLLLRSYFDVICHSIPLYLVNGNHEGELGWLLDGTANSLPVMASNTRKKYYPNPVPGSFYSGNSRSEEFVGLRQNYYSWEWGSALFVVLDPYWYTKARPGWGWTLGVDQYNWFRSVLTTSQAKFKFVFCHQLVGGDGNNGRGGTEFVEFFEMGGENQDSTWGFDTYRPGWGKTIHQVMVENNVTIYFHGHDHFYGKQQKDGIVYQEVPQPSSRSYTSMGASQYGYVNGIFIPSRGYLLVTVADTSANVQYVRTFLPAEENTQRHNRDVSDSYTLVRTGTTSNVIGVNSAPEEYSLLQNYPNPFNPQTTIRFSLASPQFTILRVYDLLGCEVATLVNGKMDAGGHEVRFDGTGLASGVYLYRLQAGDLVQTKRLMILR